MKLDIHAVYQAETRFGAEAYLYLKLGAKRLKHKVLLDEEYLRWKFRYYDQLLAQGYSLDAVGPKVSAWLGVVLVMAEATHQVCQVQVVTSDSVSEVVTYQPDSDSQLWSAYNLAQYAARRSAHNG